MYKRQDYARTRGFYGRFQDVAGEDAPTSWDALLPQLSALLDDDDVFAAQSERSGTLSAEMHAFRDGGNTRRVYEKIRARGIPAPKGAA